MKLWYKLILPIIIVIATTVFIVIFIVIGSLKSAFFENDFQKMEELAVENTDRYLQKDYFVNPTSPEAQKQFYEFSEEIRDADIVRLTIWGKDQVILFSDLAPVIGYHSPDHFDLKRLFETGTSFFIEKSEDTNKPIQSDVGGFLDTYIPIRIGGEIQGALELHMVKAVIINPIQKSIRNIIYLLITSGVVSIIAISIVEQHFIIGPIFSLKKATEAVAREEFNYQINIHTGDELGVLASNFEQMRLKLKKLFGVLENKNIELTKNFETLTKQTDELGRMNKLMINRELKMVELKKEIEELKKTGGQNNI